MPGGKFRLLVVCDGCVPTGFARVATSLLQHLARDYDVHHMAISYFGADLSTPWPIYAGSRSDDTLGLSILAELIERIEPDVVLLIHDIWVQVQYMQVLRPHSDRIRVVGYTPVDSGPVPPERMDPLEGMDALVTYTEYGRRVLATTLGRIRAARPTFRFPELEVIPHGVDTNRFHPYAGPRDEPLSAASRQALVNELYGDGPECQDAFIVLNANRNVSRKRIDITVKAFAQFSEGKPPGVRLHLHMGQAEDLGWNIPSLARNHGVLDRLIMTRGVRYQPNVGDAMLNRIYCSAAVGLNTSTAEGWGLVNFEHAATGAVQVLPRHTAFQELWEGAAVLIDPVLTLCDTGTQRDAFFLSPEDVAEALERVYADEALRQRLARRGMANACRARYRWAEIASRFDAVLRRVLAAQTLAPVGET